MTWRCIQVAAEQTAKDGGVRCSRSTGSDGQTISTIVIDRQQIDDDRNKGGDDQTQESGPIRFFRESQQFRKITVGDSRRG